MAEIDYSAAKFWLSALELIALAVIAAYTYFATSNRARKKQVDAMQKEINQVNKMIGGIEQRHVDDDKVSQRTLAILETIEQRVSAVEMQCHKQPTHDDISKIYDRLHHTNSAIDKMTGSMSAVQSQLSLVVEHLIAGGK